MSNKGIDIKSGLLKHLLQLVESGYMKEGNSVMSYKGYTVSERLDKTDIKPSLPPLVYNGCYPPTADVTLTQEIAWHHIHIERTIWRIKDALQFDFQS